MKLFKKSVLTTLSLPATALLLGLSSAAANAQQSGPLADILQRLDNFVMELEALDIQTETLENPSLEDRVLDALSIRLCSQLSGIGYLQGQIEPIQSEAEVGIGIGPNVMGSGLELKIEPKITGNVHMITRSQASISSSVCVDIYELADIIQTELDAPIPPDPDDIDPALLPLEQFARQLDDNARQQVVLFAQHSPAMLLELMVLVLKEAGIDPTTQPDSLGNGLLATVDAIENSSISLNPSNVLELGQVNATVQNLPIAPAFRTAFNTATGVFSNIDVFAVSPCSGGFGFPAGVNAILDEICGINSIINGIASYIGALGRIDDSFGAAADSVQGLASDVRNGTQSVHNSILSFSGRVQGVYNLVNNNICRTFEASEGGGVGISGIGRVECEASISFNPCSVSSLDIDFSCSGP